MKRERERIVRPKMEGAERDANSSAAARRPDKSDPESMPSTLEGTRSVTESIHDSELGHRFGQATVFPPEAEAQQQDARIAESAFQGPAREFPFRGQIEASFGRPIPAQAHVDDRAADACDALQAGAFTYAGRVAFADQSPTLGTAAHEATHAIQQREGATTRDGVNQPGDPLEEHADRVAAAVVSGRSAGSLLRARPRGSVRAGIQRQTATKVEERLAASIGVEEYSEKFSEERQATKDPAKGHVFEGGSAKASEVGGKEVGEAGYGAALGVGGSKKAQEEMAKGEYGVMAPAVQPHTAPLEKAISTTADWIKEKETDKASTKYESKPWQIGRDPSWLTKSKESGIAQGAAQLAMLERHMFEQWNWVSTYNSWAPMANLAAGARADLLESAYMLGFDLLKEPDTVRFVEGLEQGLGMATELVEATVLGKKGDASWAGRQADKGAARLGPELKGEAITPLFEELQRGFGEVQTAQLDVYRSMLRSRDAVLKEQKAGKEGEVAQINGVIAFWTNMASTIEGHWSTAKDLASGKTASEIEGYAGDLIAKSQAGRNWDSAAKRAQQGKEAGLQRAELERAENARERITGGAPPGGMSPSLSGVVGALLEVGYQKQLNALAGEIKSLEAQIGAGEATDGLIAARNAMETYRERRQALAGIAKRIQTNALANREQQYLEAGDSLDRYARTHASELKAEGKSALVPKNDKQEVYSTLMVVVGKIRAYMLLCEKAREMFPYDAFVQTALQLDAERKSPRSSPELSAAPKDGYWSPPRIAQTTKKEDSAVWLKIDSTYATVFTEFHRARIQFTGVVDKVTALLQKMKGVQSKSTDAAQNEY